jgi:hypothetical protein
MTFETPPAARELLHLLRAKIAAEEIKMRRAMDRAFDEHEAARIWRDFNVAVRPLHDEVRHIIGQLAMIAAATMPIRIVVPVSA